MVKYLKELKILCKDLKNTQHRQNEKCYSRVKPMVPCAV